MTFHDAREGALELALFAHVQIDEFGVTERTRELAALVALHIADINEITEVLEQSRGGGADAARAAGDECDFGHELTLPL